MNSSSAPVRSRFDNQPDYRELLELFAASLEEITQNLRAARDSGDMTALKRQAHMVKGAGGGYGFDGLTGAAAALETACKADDRTRIEQTFDELLQYIARIEV